MGCELGSVECTYEWTQYISEIGDITYDPHRNSSKWEFTVNSFQMA